MKKVTLLLCLICSAICEAQLPALAWGKTVGGTSGEFAYQTVTDNAGNVYTTGFYSGAVDFDPGPAVYNLYSGGMYVLKLDANGNFIWAKSVEGFCQGRALTLDVNSHIYVTGNFSGMLDFDPGPGTSYMVANGGQDAFVLKLDASGNFVWVKGCGGAVSPDHDSGRSISCDASGAVCWAGIVSGDVDCDPGLGSDTLHAGSAGHFIVIRLDASGNYEWKWSTPAFLGTYDIATAQTESGELFVTGYFSDTMNIATSTSPLQLVSHGNEDAFVVKLDAAGNGVWAQNIGGSSIDGAKSIVLDASGNICVTGYFYSVVDFDAGPGASFMSSAGLADVFVMKIDPFGNLLWAKRVGGPGHDIGYTLAADGNDNLYVAGQFTYTADIDPGIGVLSMSTTAQRDIFVLKLNAAGNMAWAGQIGGNGDKLAMSIAAGSVNDLYVAGAFTDTIDLDPSSAAFHKSSAGNFDLFALRIVESAAGTGAEEYHATFNIYPNPSADVFTIPIANEYRGALLNVYDELGRVVYSAALSEQMQSYSLDLGAEPSGIYLIQLRMDSGVVGTARLVKK
jgi:hypothetical protein